MNRRRLLLGVAALIGSGSVRSTAAEEGTPAVIPAPTELVPTVVPEVREYGEAVAHGLALGRQATKLLAAGNAGAIIEQLSPEMRDAVSVEQIEAKLRELTTNRVHFEESNFQLIFDGRVWRDDMQGVLQSTMRTPFSLRHSTATPAPFPVSGTPFPAEILAGTWTGATVLDDGTSIGLTVGFSASGQEGALSIRDQNVADAPLANIVYHPEQPLGERTADWLMPLSPDRQIYGAVYDWGGRGLDVSLVFDREDRISSMELAEAWVLGPDPAAELPALPPMRLPFDGTWWVYRGGETVGWSDHVVDSGQRHAADLTIWRDGSTFRGDGLVNEDYYAWGQPVLAPVDATVVEIADGVEDNPPGQVPEDHSNSFGNHVVLQVGNNAFLYLAHLQVGSIPVARGKRIDAGTVVGLTGNSGASSEPHLHIHVQNYPSLRTRAFGLPMTFDMVVDGEHHPAGTLEQGMFVAPAT